mmetsp:Transcript_27913/g.88765  ORF Transcript_27913/g.88765 Transcript_27913/m.88765 type:complete len:213 (-) Transcript_27913:309-947(-)
MECLLLVLAPHPLLLPQRERRSVVVVVAAAASLPATPLAAAAADAAIVSRNASAVASAARAIRAASASDLRRRRGCTCAAARVTRSCRSLHHSSTGRSAAVSCGFRSTSKRRPGRMAVSSRLASIASRMRRRAVGAAPILSTSPSGRMCRLAPSMPARGPSHSACAGSDGSTKRSHSASSGASTSLPEDLPPSPPPRFTQASRQDGSAKPQR